MKRKTEREFNRKKKNSERTKDIKAEKVRRRIFKKVGLITTN